jgi:hypothetical protein
VAFFDPLLCHLSSLYHDIRSVNINALYTLCFSMMSRAFNLTLFYLIEHCTGLRHFLGKCSKTEGSFVKVVGPQGMN